ncbi:MAG: hypothetical protein ACYCPS_07040 [Candidatus Saccharimonadales bacterium]
MKEAIEYHHFVPESLCASAVDPMHGTFGQDGIRICNGFYCHLLLTSAEPASSDCSQQYKAE